ncbi:MAG: gluconate 2-dehydrogenase subunit 3 family protein [Deltaproteobacteria bacterium]|nr:gluconate 2-dehydrogenase subunit 3 family protein [Deltaproteobacteria bacterium]MBW2418804.1 gluconate 2-dehydrogenase subunit 3 family protein [Deltaproteobacteria bacterium]
MRCGTLSQASAARGEGGLGRELSRRELFRRATLYGGSAYLAALLPRPRAAEAARGPTGAETFSVSQWRTVEAITARIIPSGPRGPSGEVEPGALEANCVNFIDKLLANEDEELLEVYEEGIEGIDVVGKRLFGKDFNSLMSDNQDRILAELERGKASGWPAGAQRDFFETVRLHTILGFLADPKYGGNRDYAGWKLMGYPGPAHHEGGYSELEQQGLRPLRTVWGDEL